MLSIIYMEFEAFKMDGLGNDFVILKKGQYIKLLWLIVDFQETEGL